MLLFTEVCIGEIYALFPLWLGVVISLKYVVVMFLFLNRASEICFPVYLIMLLGY